MEEKETNNFKYLIELLDELGLFSSKTELTYLFKSQDELLDFIIKLVSIKGFSDYAKNRKGN